MPGPAPTPTAILKARGSWRAKLRRGEPKPMYDRPTCPRQLTPEAKREWKRIAPLLEETRVLTKQDRAVVAMYCQAWADYWGLRQRVEESGWAPIGRREPYGVLRDQADLVSKLAQQLGMSPASRTRVEVISSAPEDDEFKKFLGTNIRKAE